MNPSRHVESVLDRRFIDCNRALGHQLIYRDYFGDNPTYPNYFLRRRFRMRRNLFSRILEAVESHDP